MFSHASFVVVVSSFIAIAQAAEDRHFDSNGVGIRFVIEGEGEPVILVHGFTASIDREWRRTGVLPKLSESFQVIALDTRGHGESDKPKDSQQYGVEMAQDVLRLMDHLKLERAHIVGYSLGGFTTEYLVVNHPDRLITATIGGMGWMKANDPRLALTAPLALWIENGKGMDQFMKRLRPGNNQPSAGLAEAIDDIRSKDSAALAACARAIPQLAVTREQLQANKVPTLAIIGGNDLLVPCVNDLKDAMSNLQVEIIEGTDHASTLRAPKFAEEIGAFIKAHAQEPAAEAK